MPGERQARPKKRAADEAIRQRRMDHPEEESDEGIITGESRIILPAKRRNIAEQKREFERKVEREVERKVYELRLGGQYHDRYRKKSMHVQRETQSTMGGPSRRWGFSYETEAWGNRGQFGHGSRQGKKDDRTTGFRKYEDGTQWLEAPIRIQQRRPVFGNRREVGTKGTLVGKVVGKEESLRWEGGEDDGKRSGKTGEGIQKGGT